MNTLRILTPRLPVVVVALCIGVLLYVMVTSHIRAPQSVAGASASMPSTSSSGSDAAKLADAVSEKNRNHILSKFMRSGGESCVVIENFFQGSDSAGNAYWSVGCSNGQSWQIQVRPDANVATNIVDCAVLSRVGVKCFTRL